MVLFVGCVIGAIIGWVWVSYDLFYDLFRLFDLMFSFLVIVSDHFFKIIDII